ncbi:MAG: hypothetical protein Q4C72_04915 [Eubacteriales bacterium]|nr:hypothetical protein [Eubacteriales bacterium]
MRSSDEPGALVDMLYEIAGDADAPASSRLSAIKEILDRTVGKGPLIPADEQGPEPVEIIFRIENGSNTP